MTHGSRLIDCPVLSLHMGAPVAWVSEEIVDPNNLKIVAFRLRDVQADDEVGEILETRDIREFSSIGMIIDSTDVLVNPGEVIKLDEILKLNFFLPGLKVETKKHTNLGRVIDYVADTEDFMIQQLTVKRPVLKSFSDPELLIARDQIEEITDYKIIVKDEVDVIKKRSQEAEFVPNFVNPFRHTQQPQFSPASSQNPDEPDNGEV